VDALGGRGTRKRLDEYAWSKWGHDAARAQFVRGLGLEYRGAREGRILAPGESATFSRGDGREVYFVPAAAAFSEALKEDPELLAAALHLGRLRMLDGHRDEAAALFRSALADADPSVAYLGALFLGSLEERAERFDDAERLYRDALTRVPYGQSAPLALAELLSRTGREAEARKALADRLLRVDASVIEPLWTYVTTPDQEIGTRFDLLRMEVWK
jgi:tetratricopeptide (TPR) repeat protein